MAASQPMAEPVLDPPTVEVPVLEVPVLDLDVLATVKDVLEGPYLQQMINVLERTSLEILVELTRTLDAGDLNQTQRLAHKIKGSAGNVGLRQVWAIAAQIESSDSIDHARDLFARFPAVLTEGLTQIKAATAV